MTLIYNSYNKSAFLVIPLLILGAIILVIMLFTKFFIVGIIGFVIVYYASRKKYFRFRVYEDFIEVHNLFSKKKKRKDDFLKAKIETGGGTMHSEKTIVLETRDNCVLSIVPKNKAEGVEIINILETFGIVFHKNKQYKLIKEWDIYRPGEEGTW